MNSLKRIFPIVVCIFFLFSGNVQLYSQDFYRIQADFTIKAKRSDNSLELIKGTVYYDKTIMKIVYQIRFPKVETWVSLDTVLYKIANGKVVEQKRLNGLVQFSVFNLVLNGQLSDYGLRGTSFTVSMVEKDSNMVVTTWLPPEKYKKSFGKILVSTNNRQLMGVAFFDTDERITSKQFYKSYKKIKGLNFPAEVVQFFYTQGKESYQVTNYSNIQVNASGNNTMYNYKFITNNY